MRHALAALIVIVLFALIGCGEVPLPASSVPVDSFYWPTAPSQQQRMIVVYIKTEAEPAEVEALREKIADMAEVQKYGYVSAENEFDELERPLGAEADRMLGSLDGGVADSFRILVRKEDQVLTVAERFFDDSRVDHRGLGKHDGVILFAE